MTAPHVPLSHCPACNHVLDAATVINDETAVPEAGDVSVCFYCTTMLIFNEDLTVRTLTLAEFEALDLEAKKMLKRAQRVIQHERGKA